MTGLAFLATFCLLVVGVTAGTYLVLRRVRPNGSRIALAIGVGLAIALVLAIAGVTVLWSSNSSEPLEAAAHIWALALVAGMAGLATTATMVALKA